MTRPLPAHATMRHNVPDRLRRSRPGHGRVLLILAAALCMAAPAAAVARAGTHAARTSMPTARQMFSAATVKVSTRKLRGLATVLVNAKGFTLYMFVPDKRRSVTCVRTCAAIWPPLKLVKGQKPVASGQAKAALLGSDRNPAGGRVVTYARWPLYTYVGDTSPGSAKGQALNLNGGLWYVLAPSGKLIRRKP
jgi:predicted lipoprotein with Yx(FWY)xxD motif